MGELCTADETSSGRTILQTEWIQTFGERKSTVSSTTACDRVSIFHTQPQVALGKPSDEEAQPKGIVD
ncbi:hypothetical protein CIK66_17405 [Brachybacterium alimentarium]|uniref:Uncharacterized protein n=1 Tax=Brachybacterium alimentarium TaxID=47845 RepID=A0A2A3YEN2_9MICO|nr:hypothetical protein CIK66_17405 [Brachybacterium alimentarium]